MITKEEAKQLKRMIGFPHVGRVIVFMHDKGMKNRDGAGFYSRSYVSLVFNGHKENLEVERAIWDLAELKSKDHDEHLERREALLKEWRKNEREERKRKKAVTVTK
jgi:hypothetical protein